MAQKKAVFLTMPRTEHKTQESMRKHLEEWRKLKPQQQTAEQLKPKATPLKTTNQRETWSSHKKTSNIKPLKKTVSSRPTSVYRTKENSGDRTKRKSFSASLMNKTAGKTAVECKIKTSTDKTVHVGRTNQTDELVFNENPPSNFEIESEPDPKKTRRSTFTIESPKPNTENESTSNNQPSLRQTLEVWRTEKSKLQSKEMSSRPHIKTHKNPKEPSQVKSLKTKRSVSRDYSKPVSSTRPTTSNPYQKNVRAFTKKTEIRKSTIGIVKAPKKLVQTPKQLVPPKQVNLSKTLPAKTPVHMQKSQSVRERLELWRKEKGKTPKFPKTPIPRKSNKTKEENKQDIKPESLEALNTQPPETINHNDITEKEATPEEIKKKLQECLEKIKVDKDCLDDISCQLDVIQEAHLSVLHYAEFWICKAKIAQHSDDHDRVVCLYEQAIAFSAEPASLIKDELSAYLMKRKSAVEQSEETCSKLDLDVPPSEEDQIDPPHQALVPSKHPVTPHRVHSEFPSSIIRYSVTKATPYRCRLKSCERPTVTPVRRSVRLERRSVHYPTMLQDHGITVKHLDELPQDIKEDVSFRPNFAVQSELNEAWKEIMEC